MKPDNKPSPGLAFLQAAANAMPRTLCDRELISAMCGVMKIAVECRFAFDKGDAAALAEFSMNRSSVFRPLDEHYYAAACSHGGTYARMWEAHHGIKPWIASRALGLAGHHSTPPVLPNNRIATGMGLLVAADPATAAQDATDRLPRFEDAQVWWCTSLEAEQIVLCRYRFKDGERWPFARNGQPAKVWKVSRAEWEKLNPKTASAAQQQQPAAAKEEVPA